VAVQEAEAPEAALELEKVGETGEQKKVTCDEADVDRRRR